MTSDAPPMVVKYGGNAMGDDAARWAAVQAIGSVRQRGESLVLVHGGGPTIARALQAAGVESTFVRGLRVTSDEAIDVVESALTVLGKRLAQELGRAVAVTGRDASLLTAERLDPALGHVGTIKQVAAEVLTNLLEAGLTPVVACLAVDPRGRPLNVNADDVAAAVAGALGSSVVFLSDVPGVLDDPRDPTSVLHALTADEVHARIEDGRIAGGMIPKVESALAAIEAGSPTAVVGDGRTPEAIEATLRGAAGTTIVAESRSRPAGASIG